MLETWYTPLWKKLEEQGLLAGAELKVVLGRLLGMLDEDIRNGRRGVAACARDAAPAARVRRDPEPHQWRL